MKVDRPPAHEQVYFEFGSAETDTALPSLGFLIAIVVTAIEERIPFYTRRMQIRIGRCLSGDHSHKVAKRIRLLGTRGYEGLYMVLNEFGHVLGFGFVNSTSLLEIEPNLRALARRYYMRGLAGPDFVTTDRCCTERAFYAGNNNKQKRPIFLSFDPDVSKDEVQSRIAAECHHTDDTTASESSPELHGAANESSAAGESSNPMLGSVTDNNDINGTMASESSRELDGAANESTAADESSTGLVSESVPVEYLRLPHPPIVCTTINEAKSICGRIIEKCEKHGWKTISVDSEWQVGRKAHRRAG